MSEISTIEKIPNLAGLGNVIPEGYIYYRKIVGPDKVFNAAGTALKWYNIYLPEKEISSKEASEARAFLEDEIQNGGLKAGGDLGFVLHHRAGDYLLLLIITWRHTNEMWESIYGKKARDAENYKRMEFNNNGHKGTYCVWELGPIWHERNAWVNFIKSKRDEKAKLDYLNDMFSGEV